MLLFARAARECGLRPVLSPDRVLGNPNNPQSWNRYSYVGNNPLKYADPTGLLRVVVRGKNGFRFADIDVDDDDGMIGKFEGSFNTSADLGRWAIGNLPPVSAGTPAEAGNLRSTPGWKEIWDQFVANGYQQPVDSNGKAVPIYSNYQYRELVTTANGTGQLVGSFGAYIRSIGHGQYVVRAFNRWSLESGTRLPELPGGGSNRRNPSIQEMLTGIGTPIMWPRSILNSRTVGAFGTIQKNYLWIEVP